KESAYATLYYLLVRFTRLLAPFIPFVSEAVYQNLVRGAFPQAHESVHHTRWPVPAPETEAGRLLEAMALARAIASVGLSARNNAGLKVRQPLARAYAWVEPGSAALEAGLREIIAAELNVRAVEFVDDPSQLVSYRVLPHLRLLGPRLGARLPALRAALELEPVRAAALAGLFLSLELEGAVVELAPEELLVQS